MQSKEKRIRIAKRFLDDDMPCAVAKEGRVHALPRKFKVNKVDHLNFGKPDSSVENVDIKNG